jgi:hypothetical protein
MTKSIGLVFLLTISPTFAGAGSGKVCIAPITSEMRASDHGDPTGTHARELKYDFYIQIDSRKRVAVSKDRGISVSGLSSENKHTVRIWDGEDVIESFFFTFKERGGKNLCLSFTPFYHTWSLGPPERGPWCKCR